MMFCSFHSRAPLPCKQQLFLGALAGITRVVLISALIYLFSRTNVLLFENTTISLSYFRFLLDRFPQVIRKTRQDRCYALSLGHANLVHAAHLPVFSLPAYFTVRLGCVKPVNRYLHHALHPFPQHSSPGVETSRAKAKCCVGCVRGGPEPEGKAHPCAHQVQPIS